MSKQATLEAETIWLGGDERAAQALVEQNEEGDDGAADDTSADS